jgi:hypothetical protein
MEVTLFPATSSLLSSLSSDVSRETTGYRLLLRGGVVQSVPSTAAILCSIVHPHLSSNTPDSSTSTFWLHQRHLAMTQGGGEKCP